MKMIKRFSTLLLLFLITFSTIIFPALAVGIEKEKSVSLNITFGSGEKAVTDAVFNIYLVADCDENGELRATEDFRQFNVNVDGENDGYWKDMVQDLENHVTTFELAPLDSGKTDENGALVFPTAEKALTHGLYLVTAPRHIEDGIAYDTTPFLVLLPTADRENDLWIYDVKVSPKFTSEEIPETVARKVLKVWDDKGYEKERPESITVKLLKDGKLFETVILSAENNWSYKWDALDGKAKWTVAEEPVEGYVSTVSREGITFVIKNTSKNITPDVTTDGTESGTEKDPSLPQTGLLWWPVVLLFTLGLLFVSLGLIKRRSSQNNIEK
ncbi:MAG: Cna B-type domain-containing protein [Ruminococcaceae bacterium]|nr:Cna B-type domain-containing protein [Oscillospiraceae bacterium]